MTDHHWKDFEEMGEEAVRRKLTGAFNDAKKKSAREWLAWKQSQRLSESDLRKSRSAQQHEIRQYVALVIAIPAAIMAVISIYLYINK